MKRPRLRTDLTIVEQTYRGEQSFIVKEHKSQKYFRFKLLEVLVMQQFDGEQSYAQIAETLGEQGLPLKPAAVESFARKLHQMDLLERSLAEKSVQQIERLRAERNRRVKKTHYKGSILRMRWSVGDPDEFFNRWTPRLGFFFSRPFMVISVLLFVAYAVIVASKFQEFAMTLARLYTPSEYTLGFFALFWCTGVVVIAIHEFGHGFTCKYFGGDVREMGAMLIYGQPAFYCNVNDAWTFPELRQRLWVTAAGSWIQMVVAGIAAIVWWATQPDSLVSQIAVIAVLIGGASTLMANANPLIPLDGYYALSDWLEIPNLRNRALAYVGYLVRRYVFRLSVPGAQADEREKKVFVVYGVCALLYSTSLLTVIGLAVLGWIDRTFGFLGAAAFLFLIWNALKRALFAWSRALATSVREHRDFLGSRRLWGRLGPALALVLLAGFLVPWPIRVGGTFTVGAPVELSMMAPDAGVVSRVLAGEGSRVAAGAPVVAMRNFALERDASATRRRVDSLAVRLRSARAAAAGAETRRLEAAFESESAALRALSARIAALTIRAPVASLVATARLEERLGRQVQRGDIVVRLLGSPDTVQLRVALEPVGATLVRPGQPAAVVAFADYSAARRARVTEVSAAGNGGEGSLEARLRLVAEPALRPGVRGEARITVRRTNLFGGMWWAVRKRVRSDLLL